MTDVVEIIVRCPAEMAEAIASTVTNFYGVEASYRHNGTIHVRGVSDPAASFGYTRPAAVPISLCCICVLLGDETPYTTTVYGSQVCAPHVTALVDAAGNVFAATHRVRLQRETIARREALRGAS